ncbi:ABC transporter permease [Halorussus salilacus]|uniref:ABC transporter permease n=1 Tax=Halorussus salilacus TaxID=2953750 RepID=UPI00209DDBC0|nr:ABC transporter permease [Halorussus salilacus]USZ68775.1 ABC transporter permease [Halorussus salilacus]
MSGDDAEDSVDGGGDSGGRFGRTLGRLVDASAVERILISLAALVLSVVVGTLVILVSGLVLSPCPSTPFASIPGVGAFCYDPIEVYRVLVVGAFGSTYNLGITLKETTLLVFTGLSVAVAFRAGLFNIGTQGQLVLGALGTGLGVVWAAPFVPAGLVGGVVLAAFGLLAGALVGGVWGAIPGALKAYADANEVITTIMLNFVATGLALTLVSEVFKDPETQNIQTRAVPEHAEFPPSLLGVQDFSIFVLIGGIALAVGVYWMLRGTTFGYDLRTSGEQPDAAEYGGVDAKRMTVTSMALSGAIAGIGGAVYVLMVAGYWQEGIPSLGFDGITVSILAGNNPIGVLPASLLFGALKGGSLAIEFELAVPQELVGILRGLVILFVAMPEFFRMIGIRYDYGDDATVAADGAGPEDPGTDRDSGPTDASDDDEGGEDR